MIVMNVLRTLADLSHLHLLDRHLLDKMVAIVLDIACRDLLTAEASALLLRSVCQSVVINLSDLIGPAQTQFNGFESFCTR